MTTRARLVLIEHPKDNSPMRQFEQHFGRANPDAPAALSRFAFLVGKWRCGARWVDLGPEELGGLSFDEGSIIHTFKEPMAGHAYTRATYTNVSDTHFTWRGEKSEDGSAWSEFMVVEAARLI